MELEQKIRVLEAFNALSIVLPIDDPEARASFRAALGHDVADLLPKLFMDIGRHAIATDNTLLYFEFSRRLAAYVMQETDTMPEIEGIDKNYWLECREKAAKLLNAWGITKKKKNENTPIQGRTRRDKHGTKQRH